jgi:hypothetical protein
VTTRMLHGPRVRRVEWMPGTDRLLGTCLCGTTYEADDPIAMWDWLLTHEEGHGGDGAGRTPDRPAPAVRAAARRLTRV